MCIGLVLKKEMQRFGWDKVTTSYYTGIDPYRIGRIIEGLSTPTPAERRKLEFVLDTEMLIDEV